ncbi:MAG: EAL domain-containing protein [Halofilum sp. (in: g-proteobacteria)]|nr:EAL domain-containing protein [Halofilum sp. (in: g-proteobacteria)]
MAQSERRGTSDTGDEAIRLFEVARDLVGVVDARGRITALSPHWDSDGGPGHLHDLVSAADAPAVDAGLAAARRDGHASWQAHCRATGLRHTWHASRRGDDDYYVGACTDAPEGRTAQAMIDAAGVDVTATRSGETRLAEAEARLRDIHARMPGAVYQLVRHPDGSYATTHMSEGFRELTGLAAGHRLADFETVVGMLPETDRERAIELAEASARELVPYHQVFPLDGPAGRRWIDARSQPHRLADGTVVWNGLMIDITERKEAEARAERLNAILESTPDCVAIIDTDGRIGYLNAGGCRLLGIEPATGAAGQAFVDYMTAADARRLHEEALPRARRQGSWSGEVSVVATDGSETPASQTVLAHADAHGRITHYSTTMRDLSARVRAERELAASEARFRSLYEETPVMLHTLDPEFRLVGVNAHWLETLGYRREEVIGRPLAELYAPDVRDWMTGSARREYLRTGYLRETPSRILRADGSVLDVLLSVNATYDADGAYLGALAAMTDVSGQREAEAGYRDIFEHASEGIYRSSPEGRVLRANPALARLHGCRCEEELLAAVGDIATDWYVESGTRARLLERVEREGHVENFEAEIQCLGSNERIWTSENVRAVRDDHGRVRYYEGTVRDITAQYRARRLAARRGEILEMVARDTPLTRTLYEIVGTVEEVYSRITAAVLRLQEGRLCVAAAPGLSNACIQAIDGLAPEEVGGSLCRAVREGRAGIDPGPAEASPALVAAARAAGYGALTAVPVHDQRGTVLGAVAAFAQFAPGEDDETVDLLNEMAQIASIAMEQFRLSQELVHRAQYDPLTDLPNRALLADRLEQALRDAKRGGYSVAVLLIDLDEFKLVNDTLGHSAGDALLQQVGARLRGCLRAGDTVARLGGDEFVLVIPLRADTEANDIAERVLAALQGGMLVAGHEVTARPSIGIAVYAGDGRTPEALLQAADTAMYAAKGAGKNRYRYFTEHMNEYMSERLRIEAQLRAALEHDELVLHYQPRVRLDDGRIVGAEALLRWHHAERGLLLPGQFLGHVERSPLIGDIDRWVLRAAARQAATWQRAGHGLVVSANLSTRELHADGFAADAAAILAAAGVDPAGLELEITESMLMHDFERASRQLRELRDRAPGLRIAIDDFGSGYSSLNYLRHLPIDTLKIDRSFVADLVGPDAATAGAIARTIAELGRNLGLTVVAEGVERAEQAERLPRYGCHQAQGFWYAAALPVAELDQRLAG